MGRKMNNLVRLDDKLVYHGSYNLSAKAIKVLFHAIAKYIDPFSEDQQISIIDIPLKEVAASITETDTDKRVNKSGSLYESIDKVCDELSNARIKFRSDVDVDGIDLKGYINLCSVVPRMIDGEKHISLGIDPFMKQFLFGLSQYVLTYRPEVNRLKSGYSIRLFQMLKGIARKKGKYGIKVFREIYAVEQLRFLFEAEDTKAYQEFKHFNNLIIKKSVKEINANTTIRVQEVKNIRTKGRKVSHLEFVFTEQEPSEALNYVSPTNANDFTPAEEDIAKLSKAEYEAFRMLEDFNVKPGIAYRKILPEIKGSSSEGFEDYFVAFCLAHFKKWSNSMDDANKAAATFVSWWTKKKIFDTTSDVWSKINEQVIEKKKELRKKQPDVYHNRMTAQKMTRQEFIDWWKEQEEQSDDAPIQDTAASEAKRKKDFEGIGDIIGDIVNT